MANARLLKCLCGFMADDLSTFDNHACRHMKAQMRNPHIPPFVTRNPDFTNEDRERKLRSYTRSLTSQETLPKEPAPLRNSSTGKSSMFQFLEWASSSDSDTACPATENESSDDPARSCLMAGSPTANYGGSPPDMHEFPILLVQRNKIPREYNSSLSSSESSLSGDDEAEDPGRPSTSDSQNPKRPRKRMNCVLTDGAPETKSKFQKIMSGVSECGMDWSDSDSSTCYFDSDIGDSD